MASVAIKVGSLPVEVVGLPTEPAIHQPDLGSNAGVNQKAGTHSIQLVLGWSHASGALSLVESAVASSDGPDRCFVEEAGSRFSLVVKAITGGLSYSFFCGSCPRSLHVRIENVIFGADVWHLVRVFGRFAEPGARHCHQYQHCKGSAYGKLHGGLQAAQRR